VYNVTFVLVSLNLKYVPISYTKLLLIRYDGWQGTGEHDRRYK